MFTVYHSLEQLRCNHFTPQWTRS